MIGLRNFFLLCTRFASFYSHTSLLIFFFCYFILFLSCCPHVRVFGKTLVHEFHISCSHTELYLFFFRQCNYKCLTHLLHKRTSGRQLRVINKYYISQDSQINKTEYDGKYIFYTSNEHKSLVLLKYKH